MRSASASAAGRTSFDMPPSRRSTSGMDRNFSADYRAGLSWRGRARRPPPTSEILVSSDNGLRVPSSHHDVHEDHHRSRSAAPAWSESEASPRRSTETRSARTPIQSPRLARAPSLENLIDSPPIPSATLKSAPAVIASAPPPPFRSRTPDPDYARGVPLSRVVTEPMQDSSLFNYVAQSPVDVVARRGNERAQAVSRANKLAKMGFTPEAKVLSTGPSTPPNHGHGHGHGHKFGIRSLVQSLKGKS
jgi:hypothetical protein